MTDVPLQSTDDLVRILREVIVKHVTRPTLFSELYHGMLSEIASTTHGPFDVLVNDSPPYYLAAIKGAIAEGDIISVQYHLPDYGGRMVMQEIFFPRGTSLKIVDPK